MTLNVGLLSVMGFEGPNRLILAVIILVVSFTWFLTIKKYQSLNQAKFKVINELEKNFEFAIFTKEWKYFKSNKPKLELTQVEAFMPIIFTMIAIVMVYSTRF
jgi:hypothetical protein